MRNNAIALKKEFELKWRIGARTAALIVKCASSFTSKVEISYANQTADAKSIVEVMMLKSEEDLKRLAEAFPYASTHDENFDRMVRNSGLLRSL